MIWHTTVFTLLFFAASALCRAQGMSLGDFARQERARRQAAEQAEMLAALAKESRLQQALRLSGARRQMEQVARSAVNMPHTDEGFNRIMAEAFDPARLLPILEDSAAAGISGAVLNDVLSWYGSALGARIAAAEIRGSAPESRANIESLARILKSNPLPKTRMDLARELMLQTRAVENVADMLVSIVKAMQAGAQAAGANLPPLSAAELHAFRSQTEAAMSEPLLLQSLLSYQSLSDADLSGYLDYLKTPSALAFNAAVAIGFTACFSEAAGYLGKRLGETPPIGRP